MIINVVNGLDLCKDNSYYISLSPMVNKEKNHRQLIELSVIIRNFATERGGTPISDDLGTDSRSSL